MSSGIFNYIGLGKELVFGTAVAPSVFLAIKESDGVKVNVDTQMVEAITGSPAKNKDAFRGKVEISGGLEADIKPNALGHILLSAMGAVNTVATYGESLVYTHTFAESATKQSYTIEQKYGEIIKRYNGFVFKNFKIATKAGESVNISAEGMGKNQTDQSPASTPSYETSRVFNFADVSLVKIGSLDITAKVEELEVEYDNALGSFYAVGDNFLKSTYPGASEAKGKLVVYLDDATKALYEDYLAGTRRTIEIKIEGATIGNASKNTLRLVITDAAMTTNDTSLDMDYNKLEVEFEAIEDATDGILKVELTNLISAY